MSDLTARKLKMVISIIVIENMLEEISGVRLLNK